MEILGYFLALLVGITIGLVGGGGSILTLPILVYIMGIDSELGTAYSLFIVGVTALVAAIQSGRQNNIDYKTSLIFGIPSIVAVYFTRKFLMPLIPNVLYVSQHEILTKQGALMFLFSIIMLLAAFSMLRHQHPNMDESQKSNSTKNNYMFIFIEGISVGILTGIVGAGGGFLIIPALVVFAHIPMKKAIGTSLLIIASKSLIGFIGDVQNQDNINWLLLTIFTGISVVGSFIGMSFAKRVDSTKLKKIFAWFVTAMGVVIITIETCNFFWSKTN